MLYSAVFEISAIINIGRYRGFSAIIHYNGGAAKWLVWRGLALW